MHYSRVLVFAVLMLTGEVWAAGLDELRSHYRELTENLAGNPFGMPLSVQSSEQGDKESAEIYAVLDQPFAAVAQILGEERRWCEFLLLSVNVKSCSVDPAAAGALLTLYLGRKNYQTPQQANVIHYVFHASRDAQRIEVFLDADGGPLGTHDNHIHLDALGVDGKTLIHFTSSMRFGAMSRLATSTYLSTSGRSKIGFSKIPGPKGEAVPIKGVKAMIERNAVRYFLALQVYLDTHALPEAGRFEQQIHRWFELTEHFHAQLYELPKADYLANKRRERDNQSELQRTIDNSKAR